MITLYILGERIKNGVIQNDSFEIGKKMREPNSSLIFACLAATYSCRGAGPNYHRRWRA